MMQQLIRIYNDNTRGPWWVNPAHVIDVLPSASNRSATHVNTIDASTLVAHPAEEVVKILNGHVDE